MDQETIFVPSDLFPQLIARCDFCTFVKWTLVNRKWSVEAFRHVTVVDSYFCYHYNTATRLPGALLEELPKYLHKNIRKFYNLTDLSLACRWWFTDKFLSRHARSDVAWVPTLFPLARLNAHRLTRLEIQDYDGMSDYGRVDPIDDLLRSLGPQLKELLLLNVWLTESTIHAISDLPASLEVFSVEGSSFPERLQVGRNDLIKTLLTAKALSTVRAIRLTWSIVTPILTTLPNAQNFPNVQYLDLGVSVNAGKLSSLEQLETLFRELPERMPGIQPICVLNKTEDFLCAAVESTTFSDTILDLFAARGFVPEIYSNMDYFEGRSLRDMRTHPIVAAFRAGNIAAAKLLLQRGYLTSALSLNQKMMFLTYWANDKNELASRQHEWLSSLSVSDLVKLLPSGPSPIRLFCAANTGGIVVTHMRNLLKARPEVAEALGTSPDALSPPF
eukprot:TRINITY_DN8028_c0_g1_i1.p1 TRINITY_DN8028_c0_g1~~TRINITY_DN8028_c0_g1_i1.p1  ORF type:complete len:445 (+),score=56.68 TRINITY_DN8028_c0_g1_i1:16-1350(+)